MRVILSKCVANAKGLGGGPRLEDSMGGNQYLLPRLFTENGLDVLGSIIRCQCGPQASISTHLGDRRNAVSASPTPNAAESGFLTRPLGTLGAIKLWEEVLAQTHVHVKNLGLALHKAGEILLNSAF